MMDAKARQDCIKEIDLLKVSSWNSLLKLIFKKCFVLCNAAIS